jgi:hypothetical protein
MLQIFNRKIFSGEINEQLFTGTTFRATGSSGGFLCIKKESAAGLNVIERY